jgi:heme A synthase
MLSLLGRKEVRMIGTPVLLRIASIASLLFAAGHTMGGMQSWSPPGETTVLQAMRSFRFDAEGVSRTYWDFYIGFGLLISVFLLVQAIVLWQLATLANRDAVQVRPIVAAFLISVVATGVLSWRFFFPVPLIFAIAIAACLGLALASARPHRASER